MGRSYTSRNSNSKAVDIHHEVTLANVLANVWSHTLLRPT